MIPAGGFAPYLSVFSGIGPSATFLVSAYTGASVCPHATPDPVCQDPELRVTALPAGGYTLAVTFYGNISFAENDGSGTLGDGFTGFVADYYDSGSGQVRTSAFAIDVSSAAINEPGGPALLLGSFVPLAAARRWLACS